MRAVLIGLSLLACARVADAKGSAPAPAPPAKAAEPAPAKEVEAVDEDDCDAACEEAREIKFKYGSSNAPVRYQLRVEPKLRLMVGTSIKR